MKKKVNMKNILIVLGIILGIAVFAAESGLFKKTRSNVVEIKKENEEIMDTNKED